MSELIQLSTHFSLAEFTFSETAARLGIDNAAPAALIPVLRFTANMLDVVRDDVLKAPVHVNSAYRCEALERVLTVPDFTAFCVKVGKRTDDPQAWAEYFARKQHPHGRAVDFTCAPFGTPLEICRAIEASDIDFDQLIWEHSWVHLGFPAMGAEHPGRREALTLKAGGGYLKGIVA